MGLVTRLTDSDTPAALDEVVRDLAADIAANAPLTIRATKESLRRIQASRRLDAHDTDDLIAMCYTSDDFRQGVAAFLAKRAPVFRGK